MQGEVGDEDEFVDALQMELDLNEASRVSAPRIFEFTIAVILGLQGLSLLTANRFNGLAIGKARIRHIQGQHG